MSIKTSLACLSSQQHAATVLAVSVLLAGQHQTQPIALRTVTVAVPLS